MKIEAQILQLHLNTYKGKSGQVEEHLASCLDVTPGPCALLNTFDYVLAPNEVPKVGAVVDLFAKEIRQGFSGRLKVSGVLQLRK